MRLLGTTITHMGPFEHVELDLSPLTDEQLVVAIVGDNGAGKSTLLEAMTGAACFRDFRTHGSLSAMSCARDSMLLTGVKHAGVAWSIKHLVDGREGESVLSNGCGMALNPDAKKTSFDTAVAAQLPPERLLYSTVWRAQGERGLLESKDSERQQLILLAVGATKYEAMAKTARGKAAEASVRADNIRADIARLEAMPSVDQLSREHGVAWLALNEAIADVGLANSALDIARQSYGNLDLARAEYTRALTERLRMKRELESMNGNALRMTRELDEAGKLLNRSADILVAHAEHQTLATDIERTKELRASSAHDLDVLERSEMATLKLRERAQQRAAQLGALLKDEHAIASAVVQIPDREQELEDAKEELQNAQAELEKLQGTQVAGKDERITGLRRGLSCLLSILSPDVGETTARETLETDDSLVESAATFPDRLNAAKGKVLAEKDFVDAQRRNLENCKTRAVRAPELARARTELDLVTAEQVELTSKLDTLNVEIESIRANLKALSTELSNQLKAQAEVEPLASMLNQLSRAEATRDALAPQLTELLARRASLEASQRNLIVPDAPESPPDLAALERAAAAAKQAEDTARGAVAVANERLESAKSRAVEIEVLRATLANVEQEQSDWTRLGLDLGRDGLQAALVDAAGPELTETANHLLHTCFGSRWTVQVSTQRLSADKKKAIEECEIRVWDAGDAEHEPREGEGRTFSGGEKCILDEAVSLALAHLARKSGLIDPDLVRDEAGSNLSPQRRVAWVEMLRRAAGIIGSKHIYIVSHFEDVNALADARIEVANRTARIV